MPRILIIEDEPSIVMVLQEFLSDEGFETKGAYNGESGIKILNDGYSPDLVLVDLNMPGLSGREVVVRLRSDHRFKDIPIIITTGSVYNTTDYPAQGSYQAVLEKPFDLFGMLAKIKRILEGMQQTDRR